MRAFLRRGNRGSCWRLSRSAAFVDRWNQVAVFRRAAFVLFISDRQCVGVFYANCPKCTIQPRSKPLLDQRLDLEQHIGKIRVIT